MSDAPQHEVHRRPHAPPLADPFMEFDMPAEIHRLHAETTWNTGQNARTLIKYDDFRIIFTSDQIVNSPISYLSDMPDDLKKAIRDVMLSFDKKDPAGFQKLTDGRGQIWAPTSAKDFEPVIELIKFVDTLKRQKQ